MQGYAGPAGLSKEAVVLYVLPVRVRTLLPMRAERPQPWPEPDPGELMTGKTGMCGERRCLGPVCSDGTGPSRLCPFLTLLPSISHLPSGDNV